MTDDITVTPCDPFSSSARAMGAALWEEIQHRYAFTAPDPFDPAAFTGPVGGFWSPPSKISLSAAPR